MTHIEQIRRAAKGLQAKADDGDLPGYYAEFLVALGGQLEAAAGREETFTDENEGCFPPIEGDAAHLAWEIAAAWLGEDGPPC